MKLTDPIVFEPLFMERVWGGRRLEVTLGKRLPQGAKIGESWELVDREEAQSVVHSGPLKGRTLHELWTQQRAEIFGAVVQPATRFPLLCKLLDAAERLSVQVHPPAAVAVELGGEPKTEMWYVLDSWADHAVFAGLKHGVTRDSFERGLADGTVAEQIHRVPVRAGDALFIPSGRVHAIGAGNLIVEVQQNSDTTYRVFDWNRTGLDGKPRELHVRESLQSIDFADIEPGPLEPDGELLVQSEYFRVERWALNQPRRALDGEVMFAIFTCLSGSVKCGGRKFRAGDFFLAPAALPDLELAPLGDGAAVLRTTIPA